ncbi:MAG: DUF951 domain-containing protein [Acholeplasmataceae bacterium]
MKYEINDVVTLKKKHVCGSHDWIILRTGIELKLRCAQCGREIMILKIDLDKKVKSIKKKEDIV